MGFGQTQDGIWQYLDACYVSASEATWQLFWYQMHEEFPNVVWLSVHLENAQLIVFHDQDNAMNVIECATNKDTTLTGFFAIHRKEKEQGIHSASELLYQEMPQKYIWNLKNKQ